MFANLSAAPFSVSQASPGNAAPPAKNGGDFSSGTLSTDKVPPGVILVKGAWYSASDSITPVPEGGTFNSGAFNNPYFHMTYSLPTDWVQKYQGPPPSDTGRYTLAQIVPGDNSRGSSRGIVLVTAQDMFFTPFPASNALELVNYSKNHLQADYKLEMQPTQTQIGGRSFVFYAYWSPIAEIHWYVASTEIRCHTVQFILSSQNTRLLENLLLDMNKIKLPAGIGPNAGTGGGNDPVCIKDYAIDANMTRRVEPVFSERHFNAVPVRIIVDKDGKVKHIHFLSAYPDQSKAVTDAVNQWRFKPYLQNGKPVEVETGIVFGRAALPARLSADRATE
ncbi:MAG TPA: energy transducer TonB [Candidatus Binatia bacterium]|nr:energy transducer TonB [Candidatus Binatia bacterium]